MTAVAWWSVVRRDLLLASRRRVEALFPLAFFVVAASLFPLAVGPEPQRLQSLAAGVVWVCALLSTMVSLGSLFGPDHADGTLEQMLLSRRPLVLGVLGKLLAHWLLCGLPLLLVSPLLALQFGMTSEAFGVLMATLVLGTPVLSLLGGVGAALTLGLRSAGVLVLLLVLPLCVPVLVFGAGAVSAVEAGLSPQGHLSLLAALLLLTAAGAPWTICAALRIALD